MSIYKQYLEPQEGSYFDEERVYLEEDIVIHYIHANKHDIIPYTIFFSQPLLRDIASAYHVNIRSYKDKELVQQILTYIKDQCKDMSSETYKNASAYVKHLFEINPRGKLQDLILDHLRKYNNKFKALRVNELRYCYSQKREQIITGITTLDKQYGGVATGEMVVVGAHTSVGKTTLALNIATLIQYEAPVLYISLEMNRHDIAGAISKITGTDDYGGDIFIKEGMELNLEEFFEYIEMLQSSLGLKAVIIDYLNGLNFFPGQSSTYEAISSTTVALKRMTQKYNVLCILLAHVGRTQNQVPNLHNLRDSSSIAQDADKVWMLSNIGDSHEQKYLKIEKNRHGKTGGLQLNFNQNDLTMREVCQ